MEFVWRPFSKHFGQSTQIFTHAMYDHYCYPPGFNVDERFYGDSPVVTDQELETFNADKRVELLLERIYDMKEVYRGNHMLITMGCDFTYMNAHMNFMSMDRLIEYFNARVPNITLLYSTPGMYLDAIKEQGKTYPVNYDDMFPYADNTNDYWTGYFTSRPNSKKYIREAQSTFHA